MKRRLAAPLLALATVPAAAQSELFEFSGERDRELFASHLANLGDIDGDGHDDLAVSVTLRDIVSGPNQGHRGLIEIRSGATGALIRNLENTEPDLANAYAWSMVRTEDADLDGTDDLMVGKFDVVNLGGRLLRVSSSTGAILNEVIPPVGMRIGIPSLGQIHDVNGDGRRDLMVRVERPSGSSAFDTGVLVLSGDDLSVLHEIFPLQAHSSYGRAIEPLGDLDGDGVPDVAVAAHFDDEAAVRTGKVYIHSGANWSIMDILVGSVAEERFGFALAAIDDVNADGTDDFAVSSPRLLDDTALAFVTIFSGSTRAPLQTLTSSVAKDAFGVAIESLGDADGDGIADLAVGASALLGVPTDPGRVEFYSAASGQMIGSTSGTADGQSFGSTLELLSDSNGNGYVELAAAGNGLRASQGGTGRVVVLEGPISPPCAAAITYCSQTAPNSVGGLATLDLLAGGNLVGLDTRILGSEMPPGAPALLLTSLDTGFISMPGGSQGNLCLGGGIGRFVSLVSQVGPGGRVVFHVDLEEMPTPGGLVAATPNQVWHFQAWYRDANPMPTSNFTSAVSVDICP